MEGLQKARSRITLEKTSAPDNIPPEIIKIFSIEQILLDFAYNLLMNGDKPDKHYPSSKER